jgi:hypothetical protein
MEAGRGDAVMGQALLQVNEDQQLALDARWPARRVRAGSAVTAEQRPARAAEQEPARAAEKILCAWCREKEARYGFRDGHDPLTDRPRTLCFECFRVEIGRRQAVAAQLARGWNAEQVELPLEATLKELTRRRRRAQIAARHALGV